MQNELTLEENMELARKFVQEQFVTKGMIADLAFHSPEKEDGGIPNPHFHVMTTMRPLNPDGTWGQKQRREYLLDEDGNRIRDKNGDYMFNAVHTTDWHEPETLEHWREQWAAAVNTKFEEKGLDVRMGKGKGAPEGYQRDPALVINFYNERRKQLLKVKPNRGHELLAELEKNFHVTVVTQNIDNLHERAGSSHIIHSAWQYQRNRQAVLLDVSRSSPQHSRGSPGQDIFPAHGAAA